MLHNDHVVDMSKPTVGRYVAKLRKWDRERSGQPLDLVWELDQAQADFGEADPYVKGVHARLSFFVMTFPYSSVGLARVFPRENAEYSCPAPKQIFEYAGACRPTSCSTTPRGSGAGSAVGCARRSRSGGSPPITASPTHSAAPPLSMRRATRRTRSSSLGATF